MTIKQFLKSKAFQCIVVLMAIALIAGTLLAILNDVLYVSDEERTERAIKKVYGQKIGYVDNTSMLTPEMATNKYGAIESLYLLADENYLVKSKGIDGYKGGSVTLWIVLEFQDNEFKGIKNAVVESYEKQTLMSKFTSSFYAVYSDNDEFVLEGGCFSTGTNDGIQNLSSGATFSSKAINNAINACLLFARENIIGG